MKIMNVNDLAISDLKIENYTVHNVHGERWRIIAQGADGRMRMAEGERPQDLLGAVWVRALLDGSPLPSLEDEACEYVLSFQDPYDNGAFTRNERFTKRKAMVDRANQLSGKLLMLHITFEGHTMMTINLNENQAKATA